MRVEEVSQRARALSRDLRKRILTGMPETELHAELRELFAAMEPDYSVEVTHGVDEFGKDLVMVRRDAIGTDVYGVVVKRGDLKGKTAGDVDEVLGRIESLRSQKGGRTLAEIESQIQQSLAHPAEIKTSFALLPVTRVLVVLAGEISRAARRRLENEKDPRVEVRDLDWLVDKFTETRPQVFFEGKVLDFVESRIEALETKHYGYKRGKNLSECFIEPLVGDLGKPIDLAGDLALVLRKKRMPFSALRDVLTGANRILLVGDPGSGKSGALAKLTIDMLRRAANHLARGLSSHEPIAIPLLVTARDVLDAPDLNTLANSYFGSVDVRQRFEIAMVLVDGLDEIPASERGRVIEKVTGFADDLLRPALISSRKVDIVNAPPSGFEKYEILPFELRQAHRLFEKMAASQEQLSALRAGLEKVRWQIPMVPMSLVMLIDLVADSREVPASVTELYDRFVDQSLGRWDKDKGIQVLFEYFIKKRFIASLAFREFLLKDRLEIDRAEFDRFLQDYAEIYGWDHDVLDAFVHEVERAGILELRGTTTFRHKSFLEYFAAVDIYERREALRDLTHDVVEIYFTDMWADVAFFYIGLRRELPEEILAAILAHQDGALDVAVGKVLVGRLLQAGWNSPTRTKLEGIRSALEQTLPIRSMLHEVIKRADSRAPGILADYILFILSEMAFGSAFLQKEATTVLNGLKQRTDKGALEQMLALVWAIRPFLSSSELQSTFDVLQERLQLPVLQPEDAARAALLLSAIQHAEGGVRQSLRRRLERMKRRIPETFRALLPGPRRLRP